MSNEFRPETETGSNVRRAGPPGTGPGTPSRQTLFEVFLARRRRWLLAYLSRSAEGTVPVEAAVDRLAGWERALGTDAAGLRRRIRTTLHHTHLPKLVEAGLVEYDDGSGTIRYEETHLAERFLALVTTPG